MWKFFKEINFSDPAIKQYHIDTRDFGCATNTEETKINIDLHKTRKNPARYFHTSEEIVQLLNRFFEESGGKVEWRMFTLTGEAKFRTEGWELKYIRIYRFDKGLIIASSRNENESAFVFGKHMLACPVNKRREILNAHS
jgi:hypothetical protein